MHQFAETTSNLQDADSISLRDLVDPLTRRWALLLTSFLVLSTLAVAALLLRAKQYESHMQVLVNRERQDPLISAEATHNSDMTAPVTEEEINSEAELLHGQDLLQKVVVQNGLQDRKPGGLSVSSRQESEPARIQLAVTRLEKALKVKTIPKSNILDVSYSSPDPQLAHNVLQSLGTFYIDKHVVLHSAPGSYAFFDRETDRFHQAMDKAEAQLRELARSSASAAPELERAGMADQVSQARGVLNAAQAAVASDQSRLASVQDLLKRANPRTESTKSTSPPSYLLQELGSDLLKAQTKRAQLAAKYQEGYPLLMEADQEVKIAQDSFNQAQKTQYLSESSDRDPTYEYLQQDVAKTKADLAAQQGAVSAARHSIADMQQQVLKLDEASRQRADLLRDLKTNEDSYLLYLGKREQQRASEALDRMRIANVAIAVPASLPVVPKSGTLPLALAACMGALIFSLILTYLVAYFDPYFFEAKEVSEQLGVPFVVAVHRKAA